MANEINASVSLSVSKSGAKVNRAESISVDMSGESYASGVQSITNSGGEALDLAEGGVGTSGYVFIKNLDSTNYVTFGSHTTANHTIKLKAGECALFRAAGAIYGLANTAACLVEFAVIED